MNTPVVEYSSVSVMTECNSEWAHFSLSVDESLVLRCECEGNGIELDGLYVRLCDMEKDEYSIPKDDKVRFTIAPV